MGVFDYSIFNGRFAKVKNALGNLRIAHESSPVCGRHEKGKDTLTDGYVINHLVNLCNLTFDFSILLLKVTI